MLFGLILSLSPIIAILPWLPSAAGLLAALFAALLSALSAAAALRPGALAKLGRIAWRQKPGLLVLAIIAVGSIEATKLMVVQEKPTTITADLRSARWPMFRGDLTRAGCADTRNGPAHGSVLWSGGRGFVFLSSPAVVGDTLIAMASRADDSARFFSWNASNGDLLWTLAPPGHRATFSSPVVDQGYLICGEGVHTTRKARVRGYKTDANGALTLAFEYATTSHVECTPVIDGNRVYFAAGDDGVYCLDLAPQFAGRLIWHVPGERYPDAETALAVYEGRVYVGLGRGGEALSVLDADTGHELARLPMPLPVFSPPAIADGRLYLGMGSADYLHWDDNSPGEVRCLDLKSLDESWAIKTPDPVLAAVIARDKEVIFSTVAGELFVVAADGTIKHRWKAVDRVLSAPAVTDDAIYCVSCDGTLTGLDRRLRPAWSTQLGAPGLYLSSPVVYSRHIYVGTAHDGLVCVGAPPEVSMNDLATGNMHPRLDDEER